MMPRVVTGFLLGFTLCNAAILTPLSSMTHASSALAIVAPCISARPFTVAGEHGAILGRQNGKFEAWLWPVKVLSNFQIRAELSDYAVPIDVNALAAWIDVTPAETVITYSHAAFTIRQHMFAARGTANPATGVMAFFEIESLRPMQVTFSFTPEMLKMWPAPNFGRPNSEWVGKDGDGAYILHTDNPQFSAIVAMPQTRPGVTVPYQEHPQTFPTELKLSYDPKRDGNHLFPLVMAMADNTNAVERAEKLISEVPQLYSATLDYYTHFFDNRLTVETPDKRVNEGLEWAEVAIDQAQVLHGDETGLIAGYYESADSARPGYAWFFGRDTLFTTYAINSYGDYALTRKALDFLLHRQRSDGKVMHEFSQSAESIDWNKTPYFYASADSTPLLIMAIWDYVRTSGDTAYLKQNWPGIKNAWSFMSQHEGKDGIYANSEGTGWVESWPPGMPAEEIYMAAVDRQASDAMSRLAAAMNDPELSSDAYKKSGDIQGKLESEFYLPKDDFYAFARNADGSLDATASVYPALAWWDSSTGLKKPEAMLARWASSEFSTDWGTRDISPLTSFYDPISYHQGSIWPLFTGWVSLAEYRAKRPLSAYAHLMQNLDMTWTQDLGSVTELLSGQFFQPLGRSSSHQLWSSAMVITPLLRGLFGLNWDAAKHNLEVLPNLPADWEHARLKHLSVGTSIVDLDFSREGKDLVIRADTKTADVLCLGTATEMDGDCLAKAGTSRVVKIPLKPVEVALPAVLPQPGAVTSQVKVLSEDYRDRTAVISFAAPGGTSVDLMVRMNRPKISLKGADLNGNKMHVEFPEGAGYQTKSVTFSW